MEMTKARSLLGLETDYTLEELKRAYRKAALEFHPDMNQGNSISTSRFQEIGEAYRLLQKAKKVPPSAGGTLFRKGSNVHLSINLTLKEAFEGGSREVEFKRIESCRDCKGTGHTDQNSEKVQRKCHECGGRGKVSVESGKVRRTVLVCHSCSGRGWNYLDQCPSCGGDGVSEVSVRMTIPIPPKMSPQYLNFMGEGHLGYPAGDLIVSVVVESKSGLFSRRGLDIIRDVPLDSLIAVVGGVLRFDRVDGRPLTHLVEPGYGGGDILIEPKGGLVSRGGVGDFWIRIRLVTPQVVSEELKECIKRLHLSLTGEDQ